MRPCRRLEEVRGPSVSVSGEVVQEFERSGARMRWRTSKGSISWPALAYLVTVNHAFELPDLFSSFQTGAAIYGRAVNTTTPIGDGQVANDQLDWGQTAYWAYTPSNTSGTNVYVTLNLCSQPDAAPSLGNHSSTLLWSDTDNLPIMTSYASNDSSISLPNSTAFTDQADFQFGFANFTYLQSTANIYLAVTAPTYNQSWSNGSFSYQIGLSTTQPLHRAEAGDQNRFLFLQDTDFSAALLTTGNLTSMDLPEYQIWVNPSAQSAANGQVSASIQDSLRWSWCGITTTAAQVTIEEADRSMTTRGPGGLPKEQFYVHDLVPSTVYDAYITVKNNYSSGGTVWPVQSFRTRDTRNCQIIYNLDFCNEVAYSVPSNNTLYNPTALAGFYDQMAAGFYTNFSNSVQVTNCNASADAVYSLVSNCEDCREAYKDWICAVAVPRCADLTNPASFLVYRNSSRNPTIDTVLHPGPYKEVLPCGDLVHSVTRKCPIVLGLRAPHGDAAFYAAYGTRSNNATITCNAPGVDFWVARGTVTRLNGQLLCLATFVVAVLLYT